MRPAVSAALLVTVTLPSALAAEVIIRPHDPSVLERPARSASAAGILGEKLDQPAGTLIVPFYEVDRTSPVGDNTLFAVSNPTNSPIDLTVRYLSPTATVVREDLVTIFPEETYSRSLRGIPGLPADPDGFARGHIAVLVENSPNGEIVGDYMQVRPSHNLATGDRMVALSDFCDVADIRFLDFGAGTHLQIVINQPQGLDFTGPASFTIDAWNEAGYFLGAWDVFTDRHLVTFFDSALLSESFGKFRFNFSNSGGGVVSARYGAEGRFSVGFNGACLVP